MRFGLPYGIAREIVNDPARSDDFEIFFSAAYIFDLEKRRAELEANFPADAKKRHLQLSRMIEVERGFDPMAPDAEAVKKTDAAIEEASMGKNRRKNAAKKGKLLVTRTRPKLPLKQNGERTPHGSKARRRPI